jgi:hypothetical protein
MIRILAFTTTLALFVAGRMSAAEMTVAFTVAAGEHDRANEPVRVPLLVKADFANVKQAKVTDADGKEVAIGQLTPPDLLSKSLTAGADQKQRELHFILPELKKGQTLSLKVRLSTDAKDGTADGFVWKDTAGEFSELSLGKKPVLRYEYRALDDSTPQKREETFKVYHHLYSPDGKRLVTKGIGGLYTHHRGMFYGFNKITYDGKPVDIWHCTGDTFQSHEKFLESEAGPVLGRHRIEIAWHGKGKEVFAKEEREMTVYNVPGGRLVEFASLLKTTGAAIKLDGDPQHSGFHFRADNEVADDKAKMKTIFIRPDGVGKAGEERNWDPKTKKGPVNLPWDAMSFVLGDQRFTTAHLDHPSNPKESRGSERTYGRIGNYFEYEVTEKQPLLVRYRIWLQEGQMTVEEVAAKSTAFVTPVEVKVK